MDESLRAEIYERACEILEEEGFESDFRPDYSGRAMYGSTVPGIVSDASGPVVGWAICIAMAHVAKGMELDMIPRRTDNMGLSTIYY